MYKNKQCIVFALVFALQVSLNAQTHTAVPLDDPVYYLIEQAQMRGLCAALPGVKPYSREKILSIVEEIIENNEERRFGGLTEAELVILERYRQNFEPAEMGLDLIRGTYSMEHLWNDVYFSGELGLGFDLTFAGGYYPKAGGYRFDTVDGDLFEGANHPQSGDFFAGFDMGPTISFKGDLGKKASYGFTLSGRIVKSPRVKLGAFYGNWYTGTNPDPTNNTLRTSYSEPLTYFPYTYKKSWDGFVWATDNVSSSGQVAWPNEVSIGYSMMPEFAGTLLNGHVFYRIARLDREWAGMTNNGSLVLNQSAQPFLAFETTITPFNWLAISALTGVLEYHNATGSDNSGGLKDTSKSFQNAFSLVMLEINYKNYFHIDFGSNAVWPKRFELGYLFPFADNFLYQNNIGDFDNLALFVNLKGQYPGLGKVWFSVFLDEVNIKEMNRFFELDRQLYAFQAGVSAHIPWLPFSSVTLSYTKIEPYNYTHPRVEVPWYGDNLMETNYVNFGKSLGYYLPPNSDELLLRFETLPSPHSRVQLQYQMIRHGADYGNRAVDGSSYWSELKGDRSTDPINRKYFLRDGAYQWMHIFKLGGEYSLTVYNLPVKMFGEIGGVFSYFTDIDESIPPNSGKSSSYRVINTPQYPRTLCFIAVLGFRVFPK